MGCNYARPYMWKLQRVQTFCQIKPNNGYFMHSRALKFTETACAVIFGAEVALFSNMCKLNSYFAHQGR